jgi:predicted P-loop ATPase
MQDITSNCVVLGMTNTNKLSGFITSLALEHRYHPMLEWVEGVEWDGKDRIEDLCNTVPVADEDVYLRNLFIHKWLIQTMEGVAGWAKKGRVAQSLPHVLVLAGGQGLGKTSWFRALGADRFMATECELHLNSAQGKDHQLAVLKNPMAELSEIDSTFRKSDVSSLKAFISRSEDTIRAPFAERAVTRRRMTAFCGSVNNLDFLVDATGSRRFWPIEVTGTIDIEHGLDMRQVWAQVKAWWDAGVPWTLSEEEDAARVAAACKFTAVYPEELALESWVSQYGGLWNSHEAKPIYDIMRTLGVAINPSSKDRVRRWLYKYMGPEAKIKGRANCWAFPMRAGDLIESKFILDAEEAFERVKNWPVMDFVPENRQKVSVAKGNKETKSTVAHMFK